MKHAALLFLLALAACGAEAPPFVPVAEGTLPVEFGGTISVGLNL